MAARVGVAIEDRVLVYAKGGMAYANLKLGIYDKNLLGLTIDASKRKTYVGWTLGGGLEYGVTQNWTVKGEYLYIGLPDKTIGGEADNGWTYRWNHDPSAHLIRLGLNYRFSIF